MNDLSNETGRPAHPHLSYQAVTDVGAVLYPSAQTATADLSLITRSVTALTWWARRHDDCRIHLNFPGIGNGGLVRAAVLPLLAPLPNNITIWEYTALSAPPVPLSPKPKRDG